MYRLISLLILVVDVLVIVDIVRSHMSNERKILWVLVVVFLPLVGPILYYLLEKKR
ncbi:PLDc N-terminal domain-containing protein [Parachryseolinea silvisoli]|uniref:PLDc N-terminal domain-containing protein n=1 Tax=Parachryseolinea silvisoli TaxID=2873601 RepID=UPI0022659BF5|nr:PLDc N-terminal domain-containing protein [Parachryseolinea silvisoli]MCD9019957.1 PLDc N-terminal domain-containing protein [Parachryseolinea silvisoli]